MITFSQLGKLGRLGNQMFQAATTIALAWRNNDDYILPFCDLYNTTNIPLNKFSNNIISNVDYQEPYFHYKPIEYKQNLNLHNSYFQSYKYFDDYKDQIIDLMKNKYTFPELKDYTSLHVRRGDYVNLKNCYHQLNRSNYYDKAMELTNTNKIIILSDDIGWCRDNFKGNEFEFSDAGSTKIDMAIMYSCKNNIICNSSFSWWGSYLNNNINKLVIAPHNWFTDKLSHHNISDLIPPQWIKI